MLPPRTVLQLRAPVEKIRIGEGSRWTGFSFSDQVLTLSGATEGVFQSIPWWRVVRIETIGAVKKQTEATA